MWSLGVFLQLPHLLARTLCPEKAPEGNVSLLSLRVHVTGSCCPPGAGLGICGLALALALWEPVECVRAHRIPTWCCLSLAFTGHQPPLAGF